MFDRPSPSRRPKNIRALLEKRRTTTETEMERSSVQGDDPSTPDEQPAHIQPATPALAVRNTAEVEKYREKEEHEDSEKPQKSDPAAPIKYTETQGWKTLIKNAETLAALESAKKADAIQWTDVDGCKGSEKKA
ncbi:hypothetical protein BU23DRAFT_567385 [Bimuria novae-zelandiae CBS 107.79]|uniref:Uncharacterized protein n=1 Tax=Bimuria novae-zelandiae CBS 107.79 TaxID=1447943 RepID=A0A6A5VDY8_9PLEO|nr:hypothetical protein BU23DRAFT_567385 [Bimuria novae-zelandiae CBS 107.79]